ncbi:MAG: aminotransferase class I/II-fold pyridoxal phosphate-dependent enzyme [Vicinamibacterales bacterium]
MSGSSAVSVFGCVRLRRRRRRYMPDSHLERRVRAHLDRLEARGLRRHLRPPSGIDLSSNDYLGLSAHPRVVAAFMEGAARAGAGSTGSRLLRGERDAFERVERRFAEFKGADRALYFATGYMANIAVLTTLPEAGDVVFWDAANHASLIDGVRLSRAADVMAPHNDPGALAQLLESTPCDGIRFVVIESLFSMDGDMAALNEYAALCRSMDAVLVVDEAHAVGVYGDRGSGLIEQSGAGADVCISINTAGKALGVAGAFVAGPEWAIDFLIQRARPFVFSTAPPPAVADALMASLAVIAGEPERRARLHALVRHLHERFLAAGIPAPVPSPSQIFPVIVGENRPAVAMAERLQAAGFDVRAIRPPSVPRGTARLRVSVNTGLTEEVLDSFVDALALVYQEVAVCSAESS